ncbi:alpha-D-xyloside xylohydrolase [Rathayibacter sp. PhB93]|uniref:alpha-xylosidase n=1 Tax=unclassified Rathayibacter TaxID=2609250 RepID=UPI000F489E22|nr:MULTISPECIES: alpha-xylosidase [unclassified Rathayibacter]ROQ03293.1 alpha-D-xyloside xylohydrolase [Rathayibacter sp. PhB93]TDQ09106.1 alpha-D-xyloside xylohydrolase [Rathayibacter sp. PhB1]
MKFTDGFWQTRAGFTPLFAQEAYDIRSHGTSLEVIAPTKVIQGRGDVLNRPTLTVTVSSPAEGVAKVRIEHWRGTATRRGFDLVDDAVGEASLTESGGVLRTGDLEVRVAQGAPWSLEFWDTATNTRLTGSGHKAEGYLTGPDGEAYLHEQLDLGVGELVYGLGERFGPFVKNGQTVDVWNADGGTSSEQAYKNVPFYLSSRGYGVLVNDPGLVSFEIGSETVERVQFSVGGEALEYLVIQGPTKKDVLRRYTGLAGRPAIVPAWSYGLWLTTSFTTSYDEETVSSFIDGFAERELPLSAFHFDCFWMREFQWTDLEWDPRTFPDPEGILARLHERGLHTCVWINPYIAQASALFEEGREKGYLLRTTAGDVWQWDLWVAGMALIDFTNPEATRWFQDKLGVLVRQGVDSFKTDFGERIPSEGVAWSDGSDPEGMHNWYTQLYNRAVFEVLEEELGEGRAALFARSATVGGQALPVHWGGDNTSSYVSMAETLRGGLSLALGGFGFWAHDIGGFEGTPDPGVFKRWLAFGLLSSHSRLHGSSSVRVPWAFDEEAVDVTRLFTRLKLSLMPYLYAAGAEAARTGTPVMRPMTLEFEDDRNAAHLDTQYMLGHDLLVAPVFTPGGSVEFYLPRGRWTNWWTGESTDSAGEWRREVHGFDSLPLYVREGAVIPVGARSDVAEYDYVDGLELRVFPGADGETVVRVPAHDSGAETVFTVTRSGGDVSVDAPAGSWTWTRAGS